MKILLYILVPVLVVTAAALYVWARDRQPTSLQSGVESFRQRVLKLAPHAEPLLSTLRSPDQLVTAAYHDVVLRTPVAGRVVFLGDAAHAMSPAFGVKPSNAALVVKPLCPKRFALVGVLAVLTAALRALCAWLCAVLRASTNARTRTKKGFLANRSLTCLVNELTLFGKARRASVGLPELSTISAPSGLLLPAIKLPVSCIA